MSQALFEAGVCVFPSRRGLEIFLDLLHLLHIFSLNKEGVSHCLSLRASDSRPTESSVRLKVSQASLEPGRVHRRTVGHW